MKKILGLSIALLMIFVMSFSVFASDSVTITGAWWTAWTPAYQIDGTLELDIDVKGGESNWNNLVAIFASLPTTGTVAPNTEYSEGYKEYVVFRADNWGWGGGDNMSRDGNANSYSNDIVDANENGDTWDDFRAVMADAHIDATFEKTADGIKMTYAVKGANGVSFTYVAETVVNVDTDLYVYFVSDNSEITVSVPEEVADAPQTGFSTISLAIAAIASGAYIASKKH